MKCLICGKLCTAESSTNYGTANKAVSSCCKADIVYIQHHNVTDYSKDKMQGSWHNYPTTGGVSSFQSNVYLRDYFAAKAMQSLILCKWYDDNRTIKEISDALTQDAFQLADAMIEQRLK